MLFCRAAELTAGLCPAGTTNVEKSKQPKKIILNLVTQTFYSFDMLK